MSDCQLTIYGEPVTEENRMDVLIDSFMVARNLLMVQILYFSYLYKKGLVPSINYAIKEFDDENIAYSEVFTSIELESFDAAFGDIGGPHRDVSEKKYSSELANVNQQLKSSLHVRDDMTQAVINRRLSAANYRGNKKFIIDDFYELEPKEARQWLVDLCNSVKPK